MLNDPYRSGYSVWVEVFAVVFAGVLLVGGGAYLLLQVDASSSGLVGSAPQGADRAVPPRGPSAARRAPRSRGLAPRGAPSSPLLGDRSVPGPSGAATPFSESWRRGATPSLSGPSGASGRSAGGAAIGAAPGSEGPSIADSRPGGATGTGGASYESSGRSGADWRAEARRLGGRARALSGALRQLDRSGSEGGSASRSSPESSAKRSASGGGPATSDRTTPDPPNPIPIDDHLPWLAALGLLWGAWRLHRGG